MSRIHLCTSVVILAFALVAPASAQPVGTESKPGGGGSLRLPGMPGAEASSYKRPGRSTSAEELITAHDKNGDRKLNADECPAPFRASFGSLDINHDGYLDAAELSVGLGVSKLPLKRGQVIANFFYTVTDDFIVDVYQNGEKVSDSRRELTDEIFGATVEKINIEVREGDWLVFNVVNNRLRWGGASYFAVAGMKTGSGAGFVSDAGSQRWTYCDEPSQVNAFIADPSYLAGQMPRPPVSKWDQGDSRMNSLTDGWKGSAIWGNSWNTWIKYVAPSVNSTR
jgi:hypothetical protein